MHTCWCALSSTYQRSFCLLASIWRFNSFPDRAGWLGWPNLSLFVTPMITVADERHIAAKLAFLRYWFCLVKWNVMRVNNMGIKIWCMLSNMVQYWFFFYRIHQGWAAGLVQCFLKFKSELLLFTKNTTNSHITGTYRMGYGCTGIYRFDIIW